MKTPAGRGTVPVIGVAAVLLGLVTAVEQGVAVLSVHLVTSSHEAALFSEM
jgi:hypothetical protein